MDYLSLLSVLLFVSRPQKEYTDYVKFEHNSEDLRVISKLKQIFLLI